jgi:hypothetical protein
MLSSKGDLPYRFAIAVRRKTPSYTDKR